MQSCLENRAIKERKNEIVRSDYNINNQYNREHKDANSDGDKYGRGSKSIKGHSFWKPRVFSSNIATRNLMRYDNFDTRDETIGTCYDINGRNGISGRKRSELNSMYSSNYQYGRDIIGTELKK